MCIIYMKCIEKFNIDQVSNNSLASGGLTNNNLASGGLTNNISESNFSNMFEQIPLPASDELAEYGGKYAMLEGIQSPKININ